MISRRAIISLLSILLVASSLASAQTASRKRRARPEPIAAAQAQPDLCSLCIRSELEFLASDAMRGRGSGTHEEEIAATYLGEELRRFGVEPAGDNGGYVQTVNLTQQAVAAPPVITFTTPDGKETRWTHGQKLLVFSLNAASLNGPLQKVAEVPASPLTKGAIALLEKSGGCSMNNCFSQANALAGAGAAAVLLPASAQLVSRWDAIAARPVQLPMMIGDEKVPSAMGGRSSTFVLLKEDAYKALQAAPEGSTIKIEAQFAEPQKSQTWNAVGILRGSDPALAKEAILLSAHLDHLGVRPPGVNGDDIYNGADDDASGSVAVMQLARALGAGVKPKRTVVFALFGSEERGGYGSRYFLSHAPVPLANIVANLEFEMIGRADPAVKPDELWLTGWERSDLGPTLAQHGAKLVQDPHPDQNFFERSDNIVLARRGVVAQTVSSFGLHPQYHQPSDDLAHIDWKHMEQAIGSMIAPVRWLANSDFKPAWAAGKKP